MLTQEELGWLYQFLDDPDPKGIENKIMIANIMQKLPLMLQAEQQKAQEQLIENAVQVERDKVAEKAKKKAKKSKK